MIMPKIFIDKEHAGNILQNLWLQCQKGDYCDLILIVGAEKIRISAHRNVLAAASTYFIDILNENLSREELPITNMCPKIFKTLIDYIYTGRVEICERNAVELFEMSYLLQLPNAFMACANFLVEMLDPSNCFKYVSLAEKYKCQYLLQNSKAYCLENFMETLDTDEFYNLNVAQLVALLDSDDLGVAAEEEVFNSLMLWLEHKPIEREKHKAELLKFVRMPLLQRSFLFNNVGTICTSIESLRVYTTALEKLLKSDCKTINPRNNNQFLLATVYDETNNRILIHYYNTQQLKWLKCSKHFEFRRGYAVAAMEDNLYLLGGHIKPGYPLNTVICLNLNTMNVSESTPMSENRDFCRAAVLKGYLYAVGGNNLKSVEKWDPIAKTWSKVAAMQEQRSSFGIAVLNEKLYVVGGWPALATAEYYDPCQNVWTSISTLNEARALPALTVANNIIYAIGGSNAGITSVERYDPETNNWILIRSLNEKLYGYQSCTTFRNKIIACYEDRIEEYNVKTNEWISKANSNKIQAIHRLLTYSGKIDLTEFAET